MARRYPPGFKLPSRRRNEPAWPQPHGFPHEIEPHRRIPAGAASGASTGPRRKISLL
jgi:hypothetical protein